MPRYPSRGGGAMSFGPGPVSPTLKWLIGINIVAFLASWIIGALGVDLRWQLGLTPADVWGRFQIWQLVTYMFLHAGPVHLLFNMLALWMFGAELERIWGTRYFLRFYLLTGTGAALLTVFFSMLPFEVSIALRHSIVIGASGAIYGLLLAYGLYFPDRPIYVYFVFPIPAKYFVLLMGALAFYSSLSDNNGVANATHLGGILVGYLLLKGARVDPINELKYHYLRWKLGRARRKFEVYSGGRSTDGKYRIH
ncbi:MAG: rhomboid family intramembrane serine protease [Acidobacteriaceae bacterium]|jgi:membrane associated rhomboid family serine protease|nr:rhomboid family intramembrane serine protease [Acidobacteriaceae bacterium]